MIGRPPRILICRLSHIGDCILTLPLLHALRQAIPKARIGWIVEKPADQLLASHPDLDHLITVERGWSKSLGTIRSIRKRLSKFRFDIAIDPQSISKSALVARLSGAPHRIGFGGQHGREISKCLNNRLITPQTTHLTDRSLELLAGLGIRPHAVKFRLPVPNPALQFADDFLQSANITRPLAVINPGASWPSKQWIDERFAVVARHLSTRLGFDCVVSWAGDQELAQARNIVVRSVGAAHLAPPTDLQQLAALLRRSRLFVGCDTGPTHLAAAVGSTCVVLYGPTRPQDSGAYGPQHFAVQQWYQSGSCRERRSAGNLAMADISTSHVCRACTQAARQIFRDERPVSRAA